MKIGYYFSIVMIALSTVGAYAHETERCEFAPKNTLQIPVYKKGLERTSGGISEATFNAVISKIEKIYAPLAAAKGGTLKMNRMWTTNDVNSSADRKGKIWNVNAYGGLARYPIMTPDAEAMVICHELGHHMGGYPRGKGLFGATSWASNEGQSDYYATMKCFRRIAENDDNVKLMTGVQVPKEVKAGCTAAWKSAKEIALCQRSSLAGQVLGQVLYELGRQGSKPSEPAANPAFGTPSTAVVAATADAHPKAQCRLDTYFNGAICGIAYTNEFGETDGATGACAMERGDKFGFRPLCWYKPGARR